MKTRGDILLISCYELGHQPFHLASLSALLRQEGYLPVCVDTAVGTLSDEAIQRARFVAISVPMHTALRLGERIAQRIRTLNPNAHICLYGLYALLNADHLLEGTIDSAIGGEYEVPLLKLVQALEEQSEPDVVPGVRTRKVKSGPWIQRTPFIVPERKSLPPLTRYARLEWGEEWRVVGYTEATRGCKHTCLHCPVTPIYQGRFFAVPVEIVLADIRIQVKRGARHITFGDPDFFNGPTHALRIARALHREFPDLTFDATIKIEHLLKHRHLLPEMRALGCIFVVSAVESLNDTVLERLQKNHTSADVSTAFELMEQADISLRPSLLPFSPWETLDSYIELLNFFEQQHLIEHIDPVHLSIRLLIPPGSAILDTPDSTAWLGELDAAAYTYRWRHSDPRMDALQQQVSVCVEQAQGCESDPVEVFFSVKALALAARNENFSVEQAVQHYGQRKVLPHLSESWFCCAEPTRSQLAV
ncbi:MAG: B12-binding domain-containing radical SAM protein [Ktedonobacteraceae bacterium]|nr:B12-binding domain-containing radical SAM protein [Ktedonobacteraceae bacterium]